MNKEVTKKNDTLGYIGKVTSEDPLSAETVDLVRKTVAKDANDQELQMLFYLAKHYKLDPFLKEICLIHRKVWNNYKRDYDVIPSIMTTRDGFLSIAHRSNSFDGMETQVNYIGESKQLEGATCTVWRKGSSHPIKVEVKFKEYCAINNKTRQPQALWASKPETMIKKVAESQALRKAFDVHGLYAHEEMEQAILADTETLAAPSKQLETSEALYKDPASYEEMATKFLEEVIEAMNAAPSVDAVKKWERQHSRELGLLNDDGREYAMHTINERINSLVKDLPPAAPTPMPEANGTAPQAPTVSANPFEDQVRADKAFLKEVVPDLLDIKDKFKLRNWLDMNRLTISKLLPEINSQLEAYFKTAWKATAGNDDVKYNWPGV